MNVILSHGFLFEYNHFYYYFQSREKYPKFHEIQQTFYYVASFDLISVEGLYETILSDHFNLKNKKLWIEQYWHLLLIS